MAQSPFKASPVKALTLSELKQGYSLIRRDLKRCTGVSDPDGRVGATYALATHSLAGLTG